MDQRRYAGRRETGPEPDPGLSPDPARAKAARIAAAFRGAIEPVKLSPLYRLGLVLVAVTMVLLPLAYIGLIGVVGYGLYLHATGGIGSTGGSPFLYVAPLAVGGILLVFMVKPLFAGSAAAAVRCPVHRTGEPVLWAFVEQISKAVGAPMPARIHVDCDVNASAGFRRGLMSFRGDDLVLTIGLPLVAGLRLNQLAGVLAHELGHFTQGAGMRVSYLVRGINLWFARVVYERDVLDLQLERWSRSGGIRLRLVLLLARLLVWATRKILWVLMMLGHATSCFVLRQMEFDADSYEARVAGADCFASTTLKLQLLGAAAQSAQASLETAWAEERLVDDLPRLIVSRLGRMPADVRAAIEHHVRNAPTGIFDTHPSDRDRIAGVGNTPAIFDLAAPATELFRNFDRLARAATSTQYRQMLGPGHKLPELVSVAALEETHKALEEGDKALDRFFRGVLPETRGLVLPTECGRMASKPRAVVDELRNARGEMDHLQTDARRVVRRRNALLEKCARTDEAATLADAGVEPGSGLRQARDADAEARQEALHLEQELEPYFHAAERRLASALALLPHPELAGRIPDHARLVEETPRLIASLSELSSAIHAIEVLRRDLFALATLLENFAGNEDSEEFLTALHCRTGRAVRRLVQLGAQLEPMAYPFNGECGRLSTARYVLGNEVLDENDVGSVCQVLQQSLERFDGLYLRVLGRLTDVAVRVEAAVGAVREPVPHQR